MYFTCVNTVRVDISIKSSGHNFKTFIGKKKYFLGIPSCHRHSGQSLQPPNHSPRTWLVF